MRRRCWISEERQEGVTVIQVEWGRKSTGDDGQAASGPTSGMHVHEFKERTRVSVFLYFCSSMFCNTGAEQAELDSTMIIISPGGISRMRKEQGVEGLPERVITIINHGI